MTVGAGEVKEVPLLGLPPIELDPTAGPCDDRTPTGLWSWGLNRLAMKVSSSMKLRQLTMF